MAFLTAISFSGRRKCRKKQDSWLRSVREKSWKAAAKSWNDDAKSRNAASKAWNDDDKSRNAASKSWNVDDTPWNAASKGWKVDEVDWKVDTEMRSKGTPCAPKTGNLPFESPRCGHILKIL